MFTPAAFLTIGSKIKLTHCWLIVLCAMPGLSEPGVGSGRLRSSDGRGFSKQVTAPTRLSRPGFQSRTEGSSRGATAGKAERRETMSAEWAVFHGDDIR